MKLYFILNHKFLYFQLTLKTINVNTRNSLPNLRYTQFVKGSCLEAIHSRTNFDNFSKSRYPETAIEIIN